MPLEYNRPAPPAPSLHPARQLGLLVLRWATGGTLIFWHAWREATAGWSYLWHKTTWSLPAQIGNLGFPAPLAVSIALVVIALLGAVFVMLGLLTRSSAALLALLAMATAFLYSAYPSVAENAVHYAGSCLAIALCGPGTLALDRLLRAFVRRRKA